MSPSARARQSEATAAEIARPKLLVPNLGDPELILKERGTIAHNSPY
jgi:hypothetical protein